MRPPPSPPNSSTSRRAPPTPLHVRAAIAGRSLAGLRIVVDTANGAASAIAAPLLRGAGADVVVIHDSPDGRNINDRCGATDTRALAAAVLAERADFGLALDGDADRLMAIDHTGELVDGDQIMAVCALDRLRDGRLRDITVVSTVMSNLGFRLAMEQAGINVIETAVGDRYVLEALDEGGYSMGGEQSGHIIFPEWATTGDGLLTGMVLADLVHRSGRTARRPRRRGDDAPAAGARQRARRRAGARRGRSHGRRHQRRRGDARVAGRVLLRCSGTEPLVRVMVEAFDDDTARSVADRLAGAVRDRWGADGAVRASDRSKRVRSCSDVRQRASRAQRASMPVLWTIIDRPECGVRSRGVRRLTRGCPGEW